MKKKIAIFGSTGSIGQSTLAVLREHPERFVAVTLVARSSVDALISQIEEFHPENVYIESAEHAEALCKRFPHLRVYHGKDGMETLSHRTDFDIAVSALVGIAGLAPTYNMIKNGKTVALANKEVLVAGGALVTRTAKESGATLLTVDSEHSAIMQCLQGESGNRIDKILLTASGGPFFDKDIRPDITPKEALAHPTWNMGPKVTIDSSTMMNKGFEVIEAKWLFGVEPRDIEVVVHRKSYVHSMVQFCDGTIMANIGPRSMQIPIAYALSYPERMENNLEKLDLFEIAELRFERPDLEKFKCLALAYRAMEMGASAGVVLNGANEILVAAFLEGRISYTAIANGIEAMLSRFAPRELQSVEEILAFDSVVKKETEHWIKNTKQKG